MVTPNLACRQARESIYVQSFKYSEWSLASQQDICKVSAVQGFASATVSVDVAGSLLL